MKPYVIFTLILLFTFSIFGQSDKPALDSWRGLVLDVSSPEDAVKVLGSPEKDKPSENFVPLVYSKWFGNKIKIKFRKLTFKGLEGFDKVDLYFNDGRLAVIQFDMKKDLAASALVNAYQSRFYPLVGNFGNAITPADLEEGKREVNYPERFPLAYGMAAANGKAIGMAHASSGFAETFAAGMVTPRGGRPTAVSASLPGIVRILQLVSRTLENRTGTDLLK